MYQVRSVYKNKFQVEFYVLNTVSLQVQSVWADYNQAKQCARSLNYVRK